jgi:hypothetical protein
MRKTTTRKSFIIHKDSLDILKDLTDEQAGQLFKAINHYQNGNDFELSQILKIAFNPFKNQFVRDDEKYLSLCEKNRQIAINRHSTSGTKRNQTLPYVTKSTDNDSKSDSDSDSKSKSKNKHTTEKEQFDKFRTRYPGKRKKGNETEFTNFIKKHSDWKDVLPLLEKHSLVFDVSDEKYIPSLSKWINNRDWEIESESSSNNTPYWGNNAI